MKSLFLVFMILLLFKISFSQKVFSFSELKAIEGLNEKDFKNFFTRQYYQLDKATNDSLLGRTIIYSNKFKQTVLRNITEFVTTLTFGSPGIDTTRFVSAAKAEGYRFQFALQDPVGSSSMYFKGQSVLLIRRLNMQITQREKETFVITVQNSNK